MRIMKPVFKLYISQITAVLVMLLLILAMPSVAVSRPIILSVISTVFYIILAYSTAQVTGDKDARKIKGYMPDITVPIKISLLVSVIPLILFVLRCVAPHLWAVDLPVMRGEEDLFLKGLKVAGTPDLIYRVWYLNFAAFVPSGNIFAYIIQMLVAPIIVFIGYGVGLKRFKISEFLYTKVVLSGTPEKEKPKDDKLRR